MSNSVDDILFKDIFRLNDEPFEYFDERAIHKLLTDRPEEYLDYVRRELINIANNKSLLEMPAKQIFHDEATRGDFRVMPCVVHCNGASRKTVKLIGTNIEQRMVRNQITVGKAFVFHPTDNYISHVFEACLLSSARTGICAALAVDVLSGPSSQSLTILGAGRVGFYAALYAGTLSCIKKIIFLDIDQTRAAQAAEAISEQFPDKSIEYGRIDGCHTTDILVIATTSNVPVCHPDSYIAKLIISLGADADDQHELDPAWIDLTDHIYVDTMDSVRYGDLRLWKRNKLITDDQLIDLISVLKKDEPPSQEQMRIFISTGAALFDNITIGYLQSCGDGSRRLAV